MGAGRQSELRAYINGATGSHRSLLLLSATVCLPLLPSAASCPFAFDLRLFVLLSVCLSNHKDVAAAAAAAATDTRRGMPEVMPRHAPSTNTAFPTFVCVCVYF